VAPSCACRCASTGMHTREHRLRVGHQPRKRVPPVPRRWALVVRPQLRHPFTMTLTIEVRIVRIQASHLLSPLGLDWESPESSPGKEEGRYAVALHSDGYRAPYISKGLLLPRKRGTTVTPSRNRFGLYRITDFHLRPPPFELRTAVLAQKRRKRPVWVALAGLRSDATG